MKRSELQPGTGHASQEPPGRLSRFMLTGPQLRAIYHRVRGRLGARAAAAGIYRPARSPQMILESADA